MQGGNYNVKWLIMDFKPQLENINKLGKQIEQLAQLNNQVMSKLPPEIYEKVKEHHVDTNQMLRDFKKGDINSLLNMVNKYQNKKWYANNGKRHTIYGQFWYLLTMFNRILM